MSHFYEISENGFTKFRDDIKTAAQARIAEGYIVASITTKIKVMPSDFFDEWKLKTIFNIVKENPHIDFEGANNKMWGERLTPDGEAISSSEFGTKVHRQLEIACNSLGEIQSHKLDEEPNPEWSKYVNPFMEYIKENKINIYETEYVIGCGEHNTAGTIDLIAIRDGNIELFDYKTRSCNGSIKTKTYQKDVMQLAVQAIMIRNSFVLPYVPRVNTVVIDCETGETYVKKWTVAAQEKGYEQFCACSRFYDNIEGL